jgi:hypothetical protein
MKTTERRIGIGLSKDDLAILDALKQRLGLNSTGVIRMALRVLERQQ